MSKEVNSATVKSDRLNEILGRLLPWDRTTLLFTIEGILVTLVNCLVANNNYLFATRLGADDFQLSLVMALPQVVGMLMLLPGGILTDRMKNKRLMVASALLMVAAAYVFIGFIPMLGSIRLALFIVMLAVSFGPMTLYNSSWQAYFSDVVPIENRNTTLTLRTGGTFLISIAAPLATGTLLAVSATVDGKIRLHQIFFWAASLFLIIQVLTLKKINGGINERPAGIGLKDLKNVASELLHNRRFLSFVGVALFFYMMWHLDWTLFFLGQVKYLGLNEAWLSYTNVLAATAQFLTIGFWSRVNENKGIRFSIIFGSIGLAMGPVTMLISTSMPAGSAPVIFLILNTLGNFTFAVVMLNIIQCLLQVIPERNKSLSIAIYTVLVTLSNAVMPMVGVQVYTALGATRQAFQLTFLIILIGRLVSIGLWTSRWYVMRHDPK